MKYSYDHDHVVERIGAKGYLDLIAFFLSLGYQNIHDVPEIMWEAAVHAYEEKLFKAAA